MKAKAKAVSKKADDFFDRYDFFSSQIPRYNMEGKETVGTSIGFCLTVLMAIILCVFAGSRFYFFINRTKPYITSIPVHKSDSDETVDLNKINFQVAFGVRKIKQNLDREPIHDPNYVEFVLFIQEHNKDREKIFTPIGYHKCTEEDYSKFYPI